MYFILLLLIPTLSFSTDLQTQTLDLPLPPVNHRGKILNLSAAPGSGAFHPKNDPDVVYLITDRGPNLNEKQAKEILGVDIRGGSYLFPTPSYSPTIYKLKLEKNSYKVLETIEIQDEQGQKITGLPNSSTETAFNMDGKILDDAPKGLDPEAIVKLNDGTFYISDEYLPSIIHLDATGKILKRLIPGKELPAILGKRKINHGIEALALSPDQKYLYYAMQSSLNHPDGKLFKNSRVVRMFRLNLAKQMTDRQYAYLLDEAKTFRDDASTDQDDVKLSEMSMIDKDRVLVLERVNKTTKLYVTKVRSLTYVLKPKWNDELNKPALEELDEKELQKEKIVLLPKKLVWDSADLTAKFPSKIEGMTHLGKNEWLFINDSDFGITGEATRILRMTLPLR